MEAVIDTSVLIDYLRKADEGCLFLRIENSVKMHISLITVAELYSGRSAQKSDKIKKMIEEMLEGMEIVIPTVDLAKKSGYLREKYQLSLPDALIAALALDLNIPLATLDIRDFKQIKGLKLWQDKN